jgi:RNA recognition motif-containing protein
MSDDAEARNAIDALDQAEMKGRKINVKEAEDRPRTSTNRREGGFRQGY